MTEQANSQPDKRDEALAAFTDQLLDEAASPADIEGDSDGELQGLQDTVAMMWNAFGREEPPDAMRLRIERNLIAEWNELQHEKQSAAKADPERVPLLQRLLGYLELPRMTRGFAMAAGVATVLIVLGAGLILAPSGGQLSGAAGSDAGLALIIIGVGSLVIGTLLWFDRSD